MPATYEPIATTTVSGSSTATITFSSIPASYTDLKLVLVYAGNASVNPRFQINSDTGSNYSQTNIAGDGSSATSTRGTSQTRIFCSLFNGLAANQFGICEIDFFSYANGTNKTMLLKNSQDSNGSGLVEYDVALYRSTSAINRLDIFTGSSVYNAGTTATLYGILKA
jgi:hypothetical protein